MISNSLQIYLSIFPSKKHLSINIIISHLMIFYSMEKHFLNVKNINWTINISLRRVVQKIFNI